MREGKWLGRSSSPRCLRPRGEGSPDQVSGLAGDVAPLITKPERKLFSISRRTTSATPSSSASGRRAIRSPRPGSTSSRSATCRGSTRHWGCRRALVDDRARIYALNGEPQSDTRRTVACSPGRWRSGATATPTTPGRPGTDHHHRRRAVQAVEHRRGPHGLLSIPRRLGRCGSRRASTLWSRVLRRDEGRRRALRRGRGGAWVRAGPPGGAGLLDDPEWMSSFHSFSTEGGSPDGAPQGAARGGVPWYAPESDTGRGDVLVPAGTAGHAGAGDTALFNFQLTGEVLGGGLFQSFRYRFDLPVERVRRRPDRPQLRARPATGRV